MSERFAGLRTSDLYPSLRELDEAGLRRILRDGPRATEEERYRLTVVKSDLDLREAKRAGRERGVR